MNRVDSFIQQVLEIAELPSDHGQGEELRGHLEQLIAEHVRGVYWSPRGQWLLANSWLSPPALVDPESLAIGDPNRKIEGSA